MTLSIVLLIAATTSALAERLTYDQQRARWTSPEQIHAFIAVNFSYDRSRAIALSETQRAKGGAFQIYSPEQFFQRPSGICVDVARFAVETMRAMSPSLKARYLRIKFDPVKIQGNVLRMHWLASFERGGKHYFFADSYFPDRLAGPYESVDQFIKSYQDARGRQIASYAIVDTFLKQKRKLKAKRLKEPKGERDPKGKG